MTPDEACCDGIEFPQELQQARIRIQNTPPVDGGDGCFGHVVEEETVHAHACFPAEREPLELLAEEALVRPREGVGLVGSSKVAVHRFLHACPVSFLLTRLRFRVKIRLPCLRKVLLAAGFVVGEFGEVLLG